MNILCDFHHSDLLYALQRLFEDRLGYNLFVPVGHDWWNSNYWQFGIGFGDDRLAQQFLGTARWREVEPGLFLSFDQCHPERPIYGVTLSRARTTTWTSILATVQDNQTGFHRFAQETNAKYLYHVGNARQWIDRSLNPIVLDIAQEFDHLTTFRYRPPERQNRIVSFMNLLAKIPESQGPFEQLVSLTGFESASYGHECPDGFLTPVAAIAEEMSRAGWAYHDKPTGDGFGHVIHNWAAIGRPLIGHGRYYEGQRADVFWQDGATCIDLDKHSVVEAAQMITLTTPAHHERMCRDIRRALTSIYDPAMDAIRVKNLISGMPFFYEATRATAN